eukprot:TRINITY_DN29490_c0_g1_i1.p1 TRINITY_DN29490_c0_g1~~TRINITY_DN29490_c0_g1_i1.p1  ORF type:complete len:620 (+),score=107.78 TRINITY_DN29490_c0_g1_i1:220-2079(+)
MGCIEADELVEAECKAKPYKLSEDFPSRTLQELFRTDKAAASEWYRTVFEASTALEDFAYVPTEREKFLYTRSAEEYVALRRSGEVTCEEFAVALVSRARHLRRMNQWIFSSYDLFDTLVEQAKALDAQAAQKGIEALAPLYGFPIPMKGTAAVIDYPSGSGSGSLSRYVPVRNSDLTALILAKHGLIFGVTNVPEFAATYVTANPASGHTRNPYGKALTVGGSSGGSGSVVASYISPIAVTEDTGGSTRVPAACCQNFGFDPSRNHYPNAGNPGITFTNDQLGFNSRTLSDIIFYDIALMGTGDLHRAAAEAVAAREASGIKVGVPTHPFVEATVGDDLVDSQKYNRTCLSPELQEKLATAKATLAAAGISLLREEWPSAHFDYLGREENVVVEALFGSRNINGRPIDMFGCRPTNASYTGQVATFIYKFLDAPVSIHEVVEDMGTVGNMHDPTGDHKSVDRYDETHFRYMLGPKIVSDVAAYNSYFEKTDADLLLLPAAFAATPDLADFAKSSAPTYKVDGSHVGATDMVCFGLHNTAFKHLHIPKLSIPTGLTKDGRPTAIQLWGRALGYAQMYDDAAALEHDATFLQLAKRVVGILHQSPAIARQDAPVVKPLWS